MGSAVDRENIRRELTRYREAGWGGVHIIPVYGAKGYEARYLEYLSPAWREMFRFTVEEARRQGMDVDMTLGTGWCLGGPDVSDRQANARVVLKTFPLPAGGRLSQRLPREAIQALMAFAADGRRVDVTDRLAPDGTLSWQAPDGAWTLYALSQRPSGQKVKRAAPGGEGHMLNPFFGEAIRAYLPRFTAAFADPALPRPRAVYHDSYEYQSDWSPDLLAEFQRRRGYRLQDVLPVFFGHAADEQTARIKADYRETLSDLLTDNFVPMWTAWASQRGILTRYQAHGSPGNLLDLYAAADIPETEMFNQDRDPLISKMASSAAHVAGRRLTASETGTWLAEHFTETLGDMKRLVDLLFAAGVNHVVYHGTCYSPDEAAWPGWIFYASTEMNPRNSIWHDVPALNAYIARCQSILQAGQPDNDVALYWPIHDLWHDPQGMVQQLTVHHRAWLRQQPLGDTAQQLWSRGYTFDFISDRQLLQARADGGRLATPGHAYRMLLLPPVEHIPLATMRQILALVRDGVTVVCQNHLPTDVPGWNDLEARRAQLRAMLPAIPAKADGDVREAALGKGVLRVGPLEAALRQSGIGRETMADHAGMLFIRRRQDADVLYFAANQGETPLDGWIELAPPTADVLLMDPMNGHMGRAALQAASAGHVRVYLQLEPGQSIVLRAAGRATQGAQPWKYYRRAADKLVALEGAWQVRFISGGPTLPAPFTAERPGSWTDRSDPEAQRFAGTAVYTLRFDADGPYGGPWLLNLGNVAQSARVRLNGRDCGTLVDSPFCVAIDTLLPRGNVLEVEVTNVSANRIRDLDLRKVKWHEFHDAGLVNAAYRPFNAAGWPPHPSGLLGPVGLWKMEQFQP